MDIFNKIIEYLEQIAHRVPLEIYVLLGSFVEEILAPIPSPLVMTLAGTIANSQDKPLVIIFWLALLGATGKTLGAYVLYFIADKMEDVLVSKFGKFVGITHKEIESIGAKLDGSWKDNVFLFIARALPIIPSAPVSIACGIIKLNQKTYITSTFAGTYVKDLMYLYLGFAGVGNYKQLTQGFESYEDIGKILLFVAVLAVIVWSYVKRYSKKDS
ncbi:MAG: VTT domain-containing protein [Patescibacteria group bacterium]|nr:VTT domain-containing protein [Patescibacteria group bacterium]